MSLKKQMDWTDNANAMRPLELLRSQKGIEEDDEILDIFLFIQTVSFEIIKLSVDFTFTY